MTDLVLSLSADRELAFGSDAPLFDVMATMRAMRRLKTDPVPDELLEDIVRAATWAPSGSNNQGFHFVVVTDRGQMERLAEVWRACVDDYLDLFGTDIPAQTAGDDAARKLREAVLYQRDHFHETPAAIVACYAGNRPSPDPRKLAKLGAKQVARLAKGGPRLGALAEASSIYPSVQNLLLAARAHGLGANLTTWHLFREGDVKEILGIPGNVNTYALVPLGYPQGRFGPVRRRPAETVIHRDRW